MCMQVRAPCRSQDLCRLGASSRQARMCDSHSLLGEEAVHSTRARAWRLPRWLLEDCTSRVLCCVSALGEVCVGEPVKRLDKSGRNSRSDHAGVPAACSSCIAASYARLRTLVNKLGSPRTIAVVAMGRSLAAVCTLLFAIQVAVGQEGSEFYPSNGTYASTTPGLSLQANVTSLSASPEWIEVRPALGHGICRMQAGFQGQAARAAARWIGRCVDHYGADVPGQTCIRVCSRPVVILGLLRLTSGCKARGHGCLVWLAAHWHCSVCVQVWTPAG